ncbi:MAG: transposase [Cyanobacteria bacterium J06642_11]
MAPRKLSDADKRDLIEIYRQPGETTSTIAARYGVSTSTISRILKTQIPEDEYRALIAQKRSSPSEKPVVANSSVEKPVRRARKRSRVTVTEDSDQSSTDAQLELLAAEKAVAEQRDVENENPQDTDNKPSAVPKPRLTKKVVVRRKSEDLDDESLDILDEDLPDLDDDDLDSELDSEFDDDDDEDFDDDDDEADGGDAGLVGTAVEIMPIADAVFPRTCYLVVDRLSELITHPLKEFADLGNIPVDQASALTLPVFDNHRVARRFSRRNQRIIKVPDGQIITKASYYLQAKGITHLLIDGNIYSLLG